MMDEIMPHCRCIKSMLAGSTHVLNHQRLQKSHAREFQSRFHHKRNIGSENTKVNEDLFWPQRCWIIMKDFHCKAWLFSFSLALSLSLTPELPTMSMSITFDIEMLCKQDSRKERKKDARFFSFKNWTNRTDGMFKKPLRSLRRPREGILGFLGNFLKVIEEQKESLVLPVDGSLQHCLSSR